MLLPVVFALLLLVVILLWLCHGAGANAHLQSLASPKVGKAVLLYGFGGYGVCIEIVV